MIIIKKVRLVLTDECNFKCPCCYNEGNVTKNKKVILDADKTLAYLKKILFNVEKIVLTGGEPLLYEKFNYIVEKIYELGIPIQLTTNGYYLNNLLDDSEILSKIEQINISVDDLNENEFRLGYKCDKSIYKRVINNILNLTKLKEKPIIYINCVINNNNTNIHNLKKMLDFIIKNNINGIKYIPLIKDNEQKVISKLKNNLVKITNNSLKYVFSENLIDCYEYHNKQIMILHQYCNNDCKICKNAGFIRINSDGKIYGCLFDKKNSKNIYGEINNEK